MKAEAPIPPSRSTLNRVAVRALIFGRLAHLRPAMANKLTRISEGSFEWLESRLQNIIDDKLRTHSTVGKTVDLGNH